MTGSQVYPKSQFTASSQGRIQEFQSEQQRIGVCKWVGSRYKGVKVDRGGWNSRLSRGGYRRVITASFRVCKWVGGGYRGVQGHRGGWNSRLSQAFIQTLQPGVDTGVFNDGGCWVVQVGRGWIQACASG